MSFASGYERVPREMLGLVITAQEAERARVARDLHDGVGQALTSVLLGLRLVEDALDGSDADLRDARSRIAELRVVVIEALRDARRLAFELRPTVLDDVGLSPALARLVENVSGSNELVVDLRVSGLDLGDRLSESLETVVYRIVQESLTNVVRHANANRVRIYVSVHDACVHALVEDDGMGFDVASAAGTLGLRGMSERASLVGGTLEISSAVGAGTRVSLEVPLP